MKIWIDYLSGKVIADVGSGTGRHVWALSKLTKVKEIISVELADQAVEVQRQIFLGLGHDRIRIAHEDKKLAQSKANFI